MRRSLLMLCPALLSVFTLAAVTPQSVQAEQVRVTVENFGGDTGFTSVFAGFHSGDFSLGTLGGSASPGLESLAELGMTGALTSEFTTPDSTRQAGVVGGTPFLPGNTASQVFEIDLSGPNTRLTLASMLLPSSDFFVGNIGTSGFDISSLSAGGTLTFTLSQIYDAGTELNDFNTSPGNGILGIPDGMPGLSAEETVLTGITTVDRSGNIFDGFLNSPAGGVASNPSSLRITVAAVPEPTTGLAGCVALTGIALRRRRQKTC